VGKKCSKENTGTFNPEVNLRLRK